MASTSRRLLGIKRGVFIAIYGTISRDNRPPIIDCNNNIIKV